MGRLINGKWSTEWYDTKSTGGKFVREDAGFRGGVTPATAGAGRYHLYVSLACPWAHRTLIFRKLKQLEDAISVSVVDPFMGDDGWTFAEPESVNHKRFLHEIYTLAKPDYTGRVTVPVLWDKQEQTIVSNESADIIRMLNSGFNAIGDASLDFYPEPLHAEIDEINALVYENVNNGVYKCGFATEQAVYETEFKKLFDMLDTLDRRLLERRFLCGDAVTEADWRLFTTLIRFDAVYHGHFKCNLRRIADYPGLSRLTAELYQYPGVAATVNFDHIKQHYYRSHKTINPNGIVPAGPAEPF
ncbi:MAG: glutathione S-transferase family protein [Gammaproteobacteria bacterium]